MREPLDSRAQALLKTLIERYIVEGQPVGSRTLSKYSGLDVSAATIRNVMADLEDLGLIASPHTSAGRVPTPRGYRLFVDTLMIAQPIETTQAELLEGQLSSDAPPQRVLSTAANLLSSLSQFAGVVLTPRRTAAFKHVEFVKLGDRRVLLIVVTADGDVQNRILHTELVYAQSQLIEAANYLNEHFSGLSLDEVRGRLRGELSALRDDLSALMRLTLEAGGGALESERDSVVISGERRLLEAAGLGDDLSRMRRLFDLFEQKTQLARLLDASCNADGIQIYIGGESQLVPIDELTVVTAPYEVDGAVVGTLGVIGPTRMAYDRVIPIVDITARLVSSALSHASSQG